MVQSNLIHERYKIEGWLNVNEFTKEHADIMFRRLQSVFDALKDGKEPIDQSHDEMIKDLHFGLEVLKHLVSCRQFRLQHQNDSNSNQIAQQNGVDGMKLTQKTDIAHDFWEAFRDNPSLYCPTEQEVINATKDSRYAGGCMKMYLDGKCTFEQATLAALVLVCFDTVKNTMYPRKQITRDSSEETLQSGR